MDHNHTHEESSGSRTSFLKSKAGIALAMVGVVILFYLLREHWNHIIGGRWLYLLLFLCPLMHLFGHGGHGGHRHDSIGRPNGSVGES